jgi:hypothetical protein
MLLISEFKLDAARQTHECLRYGTYREARKTRSRRREGRLSWRFPHNNPVPAIPSLAFASSALENGPLTAHIQGMTKPDFVNCQNCGATYLREIHKLPVRDQDSFECSCGHTMAQWSSSVIPVFFKVRDIPAT